MATKIGILGYAHSDFKLDYDLAVDDMVFKTAKATLKDAGIPLEEVDVVIQDRDDVQDGIAINHVYTIEPAGAFLKEESKVERDGAWAVQYAMARLMSGKFKTALVLGFGKSSQCHPSAVTGMMADPFYLRPLGVDGLTAAALQAGYFMQRSGISEEQIARVSARSRKYGIDNPAAICTGDFSVEDVMKSRPVATPIKKLDAAPVSDGVAGMVLVSEEYMKEKKLDLPVITGVGFAGHAYYPTYRNLDRVESAEVAAQTAYKMAGITAKDVDVAEVYSAFAHQDLMLYEALGFCESGKAAEFFEETSREGRLPVNASGGALCGNPIYAAGLVRMIDAVRQVEGKAGGMAVNNRPKTALAHAQSGLAMQANIVYVVQG